MFLPRPIKVILSLLLPLFLLLSLGHLLDPDTSKSLHSAMLQGLNEKLSAFGAGSGAARFVFQDEVDRLEDEFSSEFFERSIAHSGTNTRLRSVLRRALAGERLVIGVLGGSVTYGHGLPPNSRPYRYSDLLFRRIADAFPGVEHEFSTVGLPGASSGYFGDCAMEHLPLNVDLLDFSVNDIVNDHHVASYDRLVRMLLTHPWQPAVIQVEFFRMWSKTALREAGGQQLDIARFMDIPSISLASSLRPLLLAHPPLIPKFFGRRVKEPSSSDFGIIEPLRTLDLDHTRTRLDPIHGGLAMHYAMAGAVWWYLLKQVRAVVEEDAKGDARKNRWEEEWERGEREVMALGEYDEGREYDEETTRAWLLDMTPQTSITNWGQRLNSTHLVPKWSILDNFRPSDIQPVVHKTCRRVTGTRVVLEIKTTTNKGGEDDWAVWEWAPEKVFFRSKTRGSVVTFDVDIKQGEISLVYIKSNGHNLDRAKCWVDDGRHGAVVVEAHHDEASTVTDTKTLFTGVASGKHTLSCEHSGTKHWAESEFWIQGLITPRCAGTLHVSPPTPIQPQPQPPTTMSSRFTSSPPPLIHPRPSHPSKPPPEPTTPSSGRHSLDQSRQSFDVSRSSQDGYMRFSSPPVQQEPGQSFGFGGVPVGGAGYDTYGAQGQGGYNQGGPSSYGVGGGGRPAYAPVPVGNVLGMGMGPQGAGLQGNSAPMGQQGGYGGFGGGQGQGWPGMNDATAQMGMQFGKSAIHAGQEYIDKNFTRYLPLPLLKTSFSVTNSYVLRKLRLVLFPWRHKGWSRQVRRRGEDSSSGPGGNGYYDQQTATGGGSMNGGGGNGAQVEGWMPPRDDLNAPDLYIPTMAIVTYTLLAAFSSGLKSRFHPEVLGVSLSKAVGVVGGEFLAVRLGCYLLDVRGSGASGVELVGYGGYKFVGIIVTILASFLNLGRIFYWTVFFYTFCANAFFLLRSLKYVLLPDPSSAPASVSIVTSHTITHAQRSKRVQLLFVLAIIQVVWMGMLVQV